MPTYPYICQCGHKEEVIKPIKEWAFPERCPECQNMMEKDWGEMRPSVKVYEGHFNHSLGAYIGSKAQENDVCAKIEEKTGSRPVAIGDWKPPQAPRLEKYEITRDILEAARAG